MSVRPKQLHSLQARQVNALDKGPLHKEVKYDDRRGKHDGGSHEQSPFGVVLHPEHHLSLKAQQ